MNSTQRIGTPSFRASFTQRSRVSGSAFVLSFSSRSASLQGHLRERMSLRTDCNRFFLLNELRSHFQASFPLVTALALN